MSTPVPFSLPSQLLVQMVSHARTAYPYECCGILVGPILEGRASAREVWMLTNVAPAPAVRYAVAPQELFAVFRRLRSEKKELAALFHSHPASNPIPSQTDLAEWAYGADTPCIIVGRVAGWSDVDHARPEATWLARAWSLDEQSFREIVIKES